jgi:hypothetical protein
MKLLIVQMQECLDSVIVILRFANINFLYIIKETNWAPWARRNIIFESLRKKNQKFCSAYNEYDSFVDQQSSVLCIHREIRSKDLEVTATDFCIQRNSKHVRNLWERILGAGDKHFYRTGTGMGLRACKKRLQSNSFRRFQKLPRNFGQPYPRIQNPDKNHPNRFVQPLQRAHLRPTHQTAIPNGHLNPHQQLRNTPIKHF